MPKVILVRHGVQKVSDTFFRRPSSRDGVT